MNAKKIKEEMDKIERDIMRYERKPQEDKYEKIMKRIVSVQNKLGKAKGAYLLEALKNACRITVLEDRLKKDKKGGIK